MEDGCYTITGGPYADKKTGGIYASKCTWLEVEQNEESLASQSQPFADGFPLYYDNKINHGPWTSKQIANSIFYPHDHIGDALMEYTIPHNIVQRAPYQNLKGFHANFNEERNHIYTSMWMEGKFV